MKARCTLYETGDNGRKCFAVFLFATHEGVRNIRECLDEAGNGDGLPLTYLAIRPNTLRL
jgi:hypothetical protein